MTGNGNDNRTMIERVAEAIWMANRPPGAPRYEDLTFQEQDTVELIAIDCIKAMREPTEEMRRAVTQFQSVSESYQAMIDAALGEE